MPAHTDEFGFPIDTLGADTLDRLEAFNSPIPHPTLSLTPLTDDPSLLELRIFHKTGWTASCIRFDPSNPHRFAIELGSNLASCLK